MTRLYKFKYIVLSNPEAINFDPKKINFLNDSFENTNNGFHLTTKFRKMTLRILLNKDCTINAQTPDPLYAKNTPTIPLKRTEINEYFAWFLKSRFIVNLAFCTIEKAVIIIFNPENFSKVLNRGSL